MKKAMMILMGLLAGAMCWRWPGTGARTIPTYSMSRLWDWVSPPRTQHSNAERDGEPFRSFD